MRALSFVLRATISCVLTPLASFPIPPVIKDSHHYDYPNLQSVKFNWSRLDPATEVDIAGAEYGGYIAAVSNQVCYARRSYIHTSARMCKRGGLSV